MAGRARARGESEPKGRTKSAILLYLADNGECTFTQIRNHLREQYGIRSSKDVRLHLDGLATGERLGLILKISHGNGNANSYRIREGFTGLKKLHNFLKDHGAVPELMKTRYFNEYLASRDFKTKIGFNIFRNSMLNLYESIMDDEGYERYKIAARGMPEANRKAMIELIDGARSNDRDSPRSGAYLAIIDVLKSDDIDGMQDELRGLMPKYVKNVDVDLNRLILIMSEPVIPESRKEMITGVLKLSPSSLDYLLNAASNNQILRPTILMTFGYSLLMQLPATRQASGDLPVIDRAAVDAFTSKKYAAMGPNFISDSPIVLIARSLFVSDMVFGRLAVKEVPEETLRLVFS